MHLWYPVKNSELVLYSVCFMQIPQQIRTLHKFPRIFEKKMPWREWKHSFKVWTSFVVRPALTLLDAFGAEYDLLWFSVKHPFGIDCCCKADI